jgi:16S rRNA (guanine527-N7)-methyltransferase
MSSYAATRLDRLVAEHGLDARARARLERLLAALARDEAPTAIHEPDRAVDVHFADSLAGLALPEISHARRIADLGAGAGLPGLPLAIALPAARVSLLESTGGKCLFLAAVAEGLELTKVDVVHTRAEAWTEGLGACDVVCARALAALPVLCEYAAPLLELGGTLVAWKADVDADEATDGRAAADKLGLEADRVEAVLPLPGADRRTLHVYRKVAATPPGFPRRPGIATKRPLSART